MPLSERDKSPKPYGWGVYFHHTEPQRKVPCVLGDMLAPLSADDIRPITPEAMASVQQALKLLADLIDDRDHSLYMGDSDAKHAEHVEIAKHIRYVGQGLAGILRVRESDAEVRASVNAKAVIAVIEKHQWTPSVALALVLEYLRQRAAVRDTVEALITDVARAGLGLDLAAFLADCAMTGSDKEQP